MKLTYRGKQTNTSLLQSVLQKIYFPYYEPSADFTGSYKKSVIYRCCAVFSIFLSNKCYSYYYRFVAKTEIYGTDPLQKSKIQINNDLVFMIGHFSCVSLMKEEIWKESERSERRYREYQETHPRIMHNLVYINYIFSSLKRL